MLCIYLNDKLYLCILYSKVIRDNNMDKSWNYIYNMSSDEENVIRTTLRSIFGNEANEKNIL